MKRRQKRVKQTEWNPAEWEPVEWNPVEWEPVEWEPVGDTGIVVRLGSRIDPHIHRRVRSLCRRLDEQPVTGMIEYVPSYAAVTVWYDPVRVMTEGTADATAGAYERVRDALKAIVCTLDEKDGTMPRTVEIPVCYGGEMGPDLADVAAHNGLTPEEVVDIHASGAYIVYMIGFAPGFPYLGGMSERIAAPRRSTPRLSIPAGSVGIAGTQTGVYPIETPGGWQLIGRTPLALFRPEEDPPSLLRAGDIVRFRPISLDEYERWKEEDR